MSLTPGPGAPILAEGCYGRSTGEALHLTFRQGLFVYLAALIGPQGLAAFYLYRLLRREPKNLEGFRQPSASVIVPCKGAVPGLRANVGALLAQDYGPVEFIFVVPSREDPAWDEIEAALGRHPSARLVASNAVPRRCSGKIADLLFAVERVSPASEVLVFADADLQVWPDWLARLVAPLEDPRVGVATSCMLYVAADRSLWSFLRMLWIAAGMPYVAALGCVVGHSIALRRGDFAALGVARVWSASLMEDLALASLARWRGMRIRFVASAMPISTEPCSARAYFSLFGKWTRCFKVYDARVWVGAALAAAAHVALAFWFLRRPAMFWAPAAALALCDGLYLAIVLAMLRRALPERFAALHRSFEPLSAWAVAAAPLLWATQAVLVALSLWPGDVRWGGRVYRLRGPQDVEVVG